MRSKQTKQPEPEETGFVLDYEKDMSIDPNYLDAEFLQHPILHARYAEMSAQANRDVKEADEVVKTLRSQLVRDANNDPDGCLGKGIKATAPVVEAFYRNDPEYQAAKQEWIEATYRADRLNDIMYAIGARKSALENLVKLYSSEYYSSPREPMDLPEAVERLEEIKKATIRKKIRDNNKK